MLRMGRAVASLTAARKVAVIRKHPPSLLGPSRAERRCVRKTTSFRQVARVGIFHGEIDLRDPLPQLAVRYRRGWIGPCRGTHDVAELPVVLGRFRVSVMTVGAARRDGDVRVESDLPLRHGQGEIARYPVGSHAFEITALRALEGVRRHDRLV